MQNGGVQPGPVLNVEFVKAFGKFERTAANTEIVVTNAEDGNVFASAGCSGERGGLAHFVDFFNSPGLAPARDPRMNDQLTRSVGIGCSDHHFFACCRDG